MHYGYFRPAPTLKQTPLLTLSDLRTYIYVRNPNTVATPLRTYTYTDFAIELWGFYRRLTDTLRYHHMRCSRTSGLLAAITQHVCQSEEKWSLLEVVRCLSRVLENYDCRTQFNSSLGMGVSCRECVFGSGVSYPVHRVGCVLSGVTCAVERVLSGVTCAVECVLSGVTCAVECVLSGVTCAVECVLSGVTCAVECVLSGVTCAVECVLSGVACAVECVLSGVARAVECAL